MSAHSEISEDSFADNAVLTTMLGDSPKVKILAVLLKSGRDINVSEIAEQAGMSRSTVYNHIDGLQTINVVEKTREIGGSPLYQLNEESDAAEHLAKLEWDLLKEFGGNDA